MNEIVTSENPAEAGPAKIVYVLFLVSFILAITGIIGLIMAYIYRGDAPEWLKSHYRYQIRTFWIGLLYGLVVIISFVLGPLVFLTTLLSAIWVIVRCVKGLKHLGRHEALPNPATWLV